MIVLLAMIASTVLAVVHIMRVEGIERFKSRKVFLIVLGWPIAWFALVVCLTRLADAL